MIAYKDQYGAYRSLVESRLDELLRDSVDSRVLEAMRYSLLGGGKRVRGVLCLASCALCGGQNEEALLAASALEMLHCYSLIHDDLPCMDDDDLRRGQPSCHKKFGEAMAMLAGDGLLTMAFRVLAEMREPGAAIECVRLLSENAGVRGMIRGQELDLEAETKQLTLEQLNEVHRHKTGALICASAAMGAAVAHARPEQRAALWDYAEKIGLVFQIVDDILDRTSSTETLGKPVGSDMQQQKSTYPGLIGIESSRNTAATLTAEAVAGLEHVFGARAEFLAAFARQLLTRIE